MEKIYYGKREKFMYNILLIYDISNDRRRMKFSKFLEGYGRRVQYSAFEFWIDAVKFREMKEKMQSIISKDDNIRIYELQKTSYTPTGNELDSECLCDVYIA